MNKKNFLLGENHQRAIESMLLLFDQTLCLIENWAKGSEYKGVFYQENNSLSGDKRGDLMHEISALREQLHQIKQLFGLNHHIQDVASDIWSRCAMLRGQLMEISSRQLIGYGEVNPEVARIWDEELTKMMHRLDEISAIVSQR